MAPKINSGGRKLNFFTTSLSQVPRQRSCKATEETENNSSRLCWSALFRSWQKTLTTIRRNTWFPDICGEKSLFQANRIEFNSINIKNGFGSRVSFVNTLIRALRNEKNINQQQVDYLFVGYFLLAMFHVWFVWLAKHDDFLINAQYIYISD